jgi:uncharacterized heparinase superfamily protein
MTTPDPARWLRRTLAKLPQLGLARLPDAPLAVVRDLWPGDPSRGANLLRGEIEFGGVTFRLGGASFTDAKASQALRVAAHGFVWLRDLRALGTDAARVHARAMVAEWIAVATEEKLAQRPDVAASRIAAWLGHYDFFAASADDGFRQSLMARLVADARTLAAALPAEEQDERALTAVKGLIAAAVALPEQTGLMTRAMKVLPQEIQRQILSDGTHCERSPAQLLAALQDLVEIRTLLQAGQTQAPPALTSAIERMAPVLRALRHGDGGLALFNGAREESSAAIEAVLTQAGRAGRVPSAMIEGGFQRLAAGRSLVIVDCGKPAGPGLDRFAHAGTLSFELSVGRDRMIVNCGAAPAACGEWRDAARATAAHSTLVIADTSSSEVRDDGLGRKPEHVEQQRQEAGGAHWLEASHNGWRRVFGAVHRRRLYVADSGDDIRGEDAIEADNPQPFTIRFHLHPNVDANLQQDGEGVLLRLPSGSGWRLRADGAKMTLEESVYLGGASPRKSEQVVLTGYEDGPQQVKWAITRVG